MKRAHRIHVDHCENEYGETSCPWAMVFGICAHPLSPDEYLTTRAPRPPPASCPLRGSVTLVAGPRVVVQKGDSTA